MYTWLAANKHTLNLTKTEFMLIASGHRLSQLSESPSLTINNKAIEHVSSAKSLGVYIDQTLNWECHIDNVCKKIASAIGAIKRMRHLVPFNIFIKVIRSLFNFTLIIVMWCGETVTKAFLKSFKDFKIAQPAF